MQEIFSKEEFNGVLSLTKAVIYFLVEWSCEEKAARGIIQKTLDESPNFDTLVFKINVPDDDKPYAHEWLRNQNPKIVLRGGGEIVLIRNGTVVDFIRQMCYPGIDTNKAKINKWLESDPVS